MLFGKKKEEKPIPTCACQADDAPAEDARVCCGETVEGVCCVKVLGAGCKSCHALFENAETAVKNAGLDLEVEYVTDMETVTSYGAMRMPALVVNDKVVSAGRVLKPAEIEKLLRG